MIGEVDLFGVLVSSVVVTALIALVATTVVRRLLSWAGFYRFVWHPALCDTALFVIVWAGVIALALPRYL